MPIHVYWGGGYAYIWDCEHGYREVVLLFGFEDARVS